MLELSKIVSAVKPKERTDQYKILAALYCLGAHITPVATKDVTKLLEIHFAKKDLPKNISSSLRSYTAYVDPAEKKPTCKWQLTQTGLDRLRLLSGLALASPATAADFSVDVGIVCALEHPELTAVIKSFGGESKWRDVSNAKYPHVYRQTEFALPTGRSLRIVSTAATSMGLTAAAIATTHLALLFHPRVRDGRNSRRDQKR